MVDAEGGVHVTTGHVELPLHLVSRGLRNESEVLSEGFTSTPLSGLEIVILSRCSALLNSQLST